MRPVGFDDLLKLLFVIAMTAFVSCLAINVSTFFPLGPVPPSLYLIVIGGAFGTFVIAGIAAEGLPAGKRSLVDYDQFAPRWMRRAHGAMICYGLIVAAVCILLVGEGNPTRLPNGTYVLTGKNVTTKPISNAQAYLYEARTLRLISGFMLTFYARAVVTCVAALKSRAARKPKDADAETPIAQLAPSPSVPLNYGRQLAGALPVGLHHVLIEVVTPISMVAFPLFALFAYPYLPVSVRSGLVVVLFFGLAFVGRSLPDKLMRKYIPARCPVCGGPMFIVSKVKARYRCKRCKHEHMED